MTAQDEDRSSQAFPSPGQEYSCVGCSSWDSSSAAFPVPSVQTTHKNQTKLAPAFYYIHYLLWASGVFTKISHQVLKPLHILQTTYARAIRYLRECLTLCNLYLPKCNLAAAIYLHEVCQVPLVWSSFNLLSFSGYTMISAFALAH